MGTPSEALPRFVAPTPADLALAASIVDSHSVVSAYAACEWDCLDENDQIWIAAIVREAIERAQDRWQPIATAPRDGSTFLVFSPDSGLDLATYDVSLGYFCRWGCGFRYATHWRLEPAAPIILDSTKTGGQG